MLEERIVKNVMNLDSEQLWVRHPLML